MKTIKKITAIIFMLVIASCSAQEQIDVLVVGGGASGTAAGIQAARMGVHTIVLEETPWLGGMLTSAGVSCVDGNNRLRSGIFGEFTDSLVARYGSDEALKSGWVSNINFDPHVGQEILTNMAQACGELLDVRRETVVTEVKGEAGDWHVSYRDSRGRKHGIRADVIIDATDGETYVKFTIQETGEIGILKVVRDKDEYYKISIDGKDENECFEMLPYAG